MSEKFDIYEKVTDMIVGKLEEGTIPWRKPWIAINGGAISHTTGERYSIINQLLLGDADEYITFPSCKKEGGKVKKGSKSKFVVFWKILGYDAHDRHGQIIRDSNGEPLKNEVPYLRYYNVFNIADCEGIEYKHLKMDAPSGDPIESAEKLIRDYVAREGVDFHSAPAEGSHYYPSTDEITVPDKAQFSDITEYYATVFHELIHSTGNEKRLDRISDDDAGKFGSVPYSKEELVAEIGSAILMHELGIQNEQTDDNSAAYIESWIKALKSDKKMIVSASSKAEKAVRLILNQPREEKEVPA